MARLAPPVPMRSPVLQHGPNDPGSRQPFMAVLYRDIVNFLNWLRDGVAIASQFIGSVGLTAQSASLATTNIATVAAGLYRTSYSLRITQAAGVSSSATVTLGWTQNSVSASQTFAAVTGNTLATQQSGTITVMADDGTALTVAVLYASVGAPVMTYALDAMVEALP